MGWEEVVRYVIDPGFYQTDVCVLMNRKTPGRSSCQRKKLIARGPSRKQSVRPMTFPGSWQGRKDSFSSPGGVQAIEFRDNEKEFYLDTAYRAGWEKVIAKSPSSGASQKADGAMM